MGWLCNFYMDYVNPSSLGAYGMVVSGSASGPIVKLELSGASNFQTITYLVGNTSWFSSTPAWDGNQSDLLYGSNGIAALTFCSVPILPSASSGTIGNQPASGVTTNSAVLNATLGCSGTNVSVYAYWGTVNGGTSPAAWANSAYVGSWSNVVSTNVSYTATGLSESTTYYFTFCGTNAGGSVWGDTPLNFTTLGPPLVENSAGVINLGGGLEQLQGTLINGPADVRVYWGTTDGSTNQANWANSVLLTGVASGAFSGNASNLLYGLTYYYRCQASNQLGVAWAPATASFTMQPISGSLVYSIITNNGNTIIIFTNGSGAWMPPAGVTNVQVLVVGGGGGGGGNSGGGGGAGGVIYSNGFPVSGTVSVTVGGGGAGGVNGGAAPGNGTNSVFSSLTAVGGGNGASAGTSTYAAGSGGSGGGGFWNSGTGGGGTSGQGNSGGNMTGGSAGYAGAGGGGAGAVGSAANNTVTGAAGGVGVQYSISGSAQWYGGGGGGGADSQRGGTSGGSGGSGGGGQGAGSGAPMAGTANTGGGGGGGANDSGSVNGAAGGLGVVIVSYAIPVPPVVDNSAGATNLSVGVAQLQGTLTNGPADVRLYWGTADGGTNQANWANMSLLTGAANGGFASNISNLLYGLTYYYRCCASNQWGVAWSPATASFTTLKPVATTAVQIPYSNLVEVFASSQYSGYPATNAFNGAGLQADGTHTTSGNWFSSGASPVANEWLKVRFDQAYVLDHLRVWAFNAGSVAPDVTNADVYVLGSATDPAGNVNLGGGPFKTNGWSLLLPQQYFTPSLGAVTETNTDPDISLEGVTAQQLALKINNVVSGTYAGFAEVQIYQSPPVLSLNNSAATGVGASTAGLNATLEYMGAVYEVYAYWNTVNGATDAALWTNSAYVGSWTNIGSTNLSYTVTGLTPGATYYFTFCATNVVDTLWAANVQSFTTLAVPPTPVLPLDGVTVTNGVPSFSFTAAAGCKYRLQYKNALTNAVWAYGPWSTNTTDSPLPMTLSDPTAVGQPQRFYRLEAAYP
jgi:hypothetical protein